MKEIWKTIKQFPSYAVSNKGRVKRITPGYRGMGGARVGYIMKLRTDDGGYKRLHLSVDGVITKCLVHHLVLLAFKGNRPSLKHDGAHWDNNPANNTIKNLRWANKKQNAKDKIRHGTHPIGEKNGHAKLTDKNVRKIRQLRKQGLKTQELADKFGIWPSHISRLCNGKSRLTA